MLVMTSQPLERFLEIKTIIGEQIKNIKEPVTEIK